MCVCACSTPRLCVLQSTWCVSCIAWWPPLGCAGMKEPGRFQAASAVKVPPTFSTLTPSLHPPLGPPFRLTGPHCLISAEAYVPPQLFYNGKVDYFDLQRLGGLLSHLKKTLKGRWRCRAEVAAHSLDGCSCRSAPLGGAQSSSSFNYCSNYILSHWQYRHSGIRDDIITISLKHSISRW